MPKNKGKGGKNRKRGRNESEDTKQPLEIDFKQADQEYAQVVRMLGNGRCECLCIDGVERSGHIRGKMHKKVWISAGDMVLLSLRADIIGKYRPGEARRLKLYKEIPESFRADADDDEDDYVEFEEEDIDNI